MQTTTKKFNPHDNYEKIANIQKKEAIAINKKLEEVRQKNAALKKAVK